MQILILFLLFLLQFVNGGRIMKCGMVTRKSNIGIGIFATRDYKANSIIERSVTIPIHPDLFDDDIIFDEYAFGHYENKIYYYDMVLGYAMAYNHHEISNVKIVSNLLKSPRLHISRENDAFRFDNIYDFVVLAKRDIVMGEELYSSYGNENWFTERQISYIEQPLLNKFSIEELQNTSDYRNIPGCPYGLTEIHDGRLYAKNIILKDTIIEVSRGLIVNVTLPMNNSLNHFIWRSLLDESYMLLLGTGALYRGRDDEEISNVDYSWYNEDEDEDYFGNNDLQNINVNVNLNMDGSMIDSPIVCRDKMLVRFVANRNIDIHEELIIDLFKVQNETDDSLIPRYAYFDYKCF